MTKEQYLTLRNEMTEVAEKLIAESKLGDSDEKMQEIKDLDKKWESAKLANGYTQDCENYSSQKGDYAINVKDYGAVGDGVTDDTEAIQSALDHIQSNSGGTLFFPDGVYKVHNTLEVFQGTKMLLSHRAVIERGSAYSPMFLNGRRDDQYTLYNGQGNILIEGGTIDGGGNINSRASEIMFAHARNITIKEINFINNYDSHSIEINSIYGVKIVNCTFSQYSGERLTEAIQIDLMISSDAFPHMGIYDNTPCQDVLVQGCSFLSTSRGVGTHSAVTGFPATNIRIIGNHFENLEGQAVRGFDWNDVVVSGNTMINCGEGVEIRSTQQDSCGWTVANNIINGSHRLGHAISVTEDNGYSAHNVTIVGNSCDGNNGNTFYFRNATKMNITGNTLSNGNASSMWFTGEVNRITINGNTIDQTKSGRGISFEGGAMSRISITNNTVDTTASFGIALYKINHGIIAKNYVRNTGNFGIYLTDNTDYVNVTGNKVFGSSGIHIRLSAGANNNLVKGNHIHGDHNEAVGITSTCDNNAVIGNMARGRTISGGTNTYFAENVN